MSEGGHYRNKRRRKDFQPLSNIHFSTRKPDAEYAAAGILPVCGDLVLLGSEPVVRRGIHQVWWGAFGGRREAQDCDDARQTAWREFHEETGKAFCSSDSLSLPLTVSFDAADFERRCLFSCRSDRARYVLFLLSVPYLETLPRFTDKDASMDDTLNKRELRWVPIRSLMRAVIARRDRGTMWSSETDLPGVGKVAPFIFNMLRNHFAIINRRLQNQDNSQIVDETTSHTEVSCQKSSRRRREYFSSQR